MLTATVGSISTSCSEMSDVPKSSRYGEFLTRSIKEAHDDNVEDDLSFQSKYY